MDGPAFERVVIHRRELSGSREGSAVVGVKDDEIGIGSGLDGALFREEVKDFCGIRGGGADEGMEVEAAGSDAVGIKEGDAFLE